MLTILRTGELLLDAFQLNVFASGQYEDAYDDNSTWSTGDWDGDRDFTASDFVVAFQDGGYERGTSASAIGVPEPSGLALLSMALLTTVRRSFQRMKHQTT